MNTQIERARLLIQQSKYELADKELRRALGQEPDNAEAHLLLGICLLQQDRYQEATDEAKMAIHLAPDWAEPHRVLGAIYTQRNRYDQAESALNESLRLDPHDDDTYGLLAQVHMGKERWQQALDYAEQGLAIDAENALCGNLRALALERLGRSEIAVDAARQSLQQHPDDATTHATYGWSLLNAGKYKEAQDSFREALRLEPSNKFAQQGMVQALNSSNLLFRLAFKYYSLMGRLSGAAQWAIILGLLFGQRILNSMAQQMPQLQPLVIPIILLYVAFVVLTWTANPVFNTMLRFNPYGRFLLDRKQIWASNCIAAMMAFGILSGLLVGLTLDPMWGLFFFGYSVFMLLPIGGTFGCPDGWPMAVMGLVTVVLAAIGLYALILPILGQDPPLGAFLAFVYGNFGAQLLANVLARTEVQK